MSLLRSIFRNKAKETGEKSNAKDNTDIQETNPSQEAETVSRDKVSPEEFLDHWIIQAIETGASDIHFEKFRTYLRVRYRVDGRLRTIAKLPENLHGGVIARIKILAKLKIDEKRLPQDGRFSIKHREEQFDVRVSILPGYLGECVVLRLLQSDEKMFSLKNLGAREIDIKKLEELVAVQNGIIIVAGPTGSGKSTTLYSIIKKISSSERKVITVEDPVEYQLAGINQVSVNETIGMTFATALRSMLRQAPNIILIGEIRDKETAEIAIRAALTGHLVLSTVHAKDTISAITRLGDLGIPSYLIAATLRGVMAQRLARKPCLKCLTPGEPDRKLIDEISTGYSIPDDVTVYEPSGCNHCFGTGHQGRLALFEILHISDAMQKLIHGRSDEDQLRALAKTEGIEFLKNVTIDQYLHGRIGRETLMSLAAEMA
ncbi:MAG: GspE/PulE family protein [Puniceicoccales bacterium]|jgi:type II secretory ATPase GspE/PulE/Tfp pilus assembly ATPase PilB-like protein|nr:GspE/PulE family protein [Puniceicoccales bacterium]